MPCPSCRIFSYGLNHNYRIHRFQGFPFSQCCRRHYNDLGLACPWLARHWVIHRVRVEMSVGGSASPRLAAVAGAALAWPSRAFWALRLALSPALNSLKTLLNILCVSVGAICGEQPLISSALNYICLWLPEQALFMLAFFACYWQASLNRWVSFPV